MIADVLIHFYVGTDYVVQFYSLLEKFKKGYI